MDLKRLIVRFQKSENNKKQVEANDSRRT
jgi:hypothetical protein